MTTDKAHSASAQDILERPEGSLIAGMRALPLAKILLQYWSHVAPENRKIAVLNLLKGIAVREPLRLFSSLLHGRKVAQTEISQPPLFVLGHWRSGTTYLHELLALDPKHIVPNTLECFGPDHFILLEDRLLKRDKTTKRAMDNVEVSLRTPQEDEFALMNMGIPSPYLRIIFPNAWPIPNLDWLTLEPLTKKQKTQWQKALLLFCKRLTYFKGNKRLVLKSPPHTARIPVIKAIFPEARYLFLSRNPLNVIPSTMKTWELLSRRHGLSQPLEETLVKSFDEALESYQLVHEAYERGKALLNPNQIIEVRYEDLIANPVQTLQNCYDHLGLGDLEPLKKKLLERQKREKNYASGLYQLNPQQEEKIKATLKPWFTRFGYEEQ